MDESRRKVFEARYGVILRHHLGPGPGQDGVVIQSNRMTAAKFFDRSERYSRELEVYRVLRGKGIRKIAGHNVPELILEDDALAALELTIVQPPFVLDFAGAKTPDEVPDFEAQTLQEHYEKLQELFGKQWTDALYLAEMFRVATGFTLLDVHPGNIAFGDP
jgi:hypothetical protein